jgi:hypothetical protein
MDIQAFMKINIDLCPFGINLLSVAYLPKSERKKNSQIAYFKNAKKTRQKVEISKRQKTSLLMPNGH